MKFRDAIAAHAKWKVTLANYLKSPDGALKPDDICKDNKCALGQWIYGDAVSLCNGDPEYDKLKLQHARFHRAASEVVIQIHSKTTHSEEELLGERSEFGQASGAVIEILQRFDLHYKDPDEELDREPASPTAKVAWQLEMQLKALGAKFERSMEKRESLSYIDYLTGELKNAIFVSKRVSQQLLDNAGDGFMSVNNKGIINSEFSRVVEDMLLMKPADRKFSSIFGNEHEKEIDDIVVMIFSGNLEFSSLAALLPSSSFMNLRYLEFTYKPILDQNQKLTDFLVII